MEQMVSDDVDQLPVAAVCNNLDLYMASLRNRYVGSILEEVCQLADGFVVASSCIDAKHNCGYVTRYDSLENIPTVANLFINPGFGPCSSLVTTTTSSSSSSSQPLIIGGFDSGNIVAFGAEQLEIVENRRFFHNIVSRVRLSSGSQRQLVAADLDGRITVIDVETFDALRIFEYAHDGPVNDIQLHPQAKNDSLFLSAGGDNAILLWDLRTASSTTPAMTTIVPPAKAVLSCSSQGTALHWATEGEVLFGTEAGNLVRFDLRSKRALAVQAAFDDRPLRKIVPVLGKEGHSVVAIIADDTKEVLYYNRKFDAGSSSGGLLSKQTYDFEVRSVVELGPPKVNDNKSSSSSRLVTIGCAGGITLQQTSDILH